MSPDPPTIAVLPSADKAIELPCSAAPVGSLTDGQLGLASFISNQNPPSVDYKTMPDAPAQATMPDAASAPWKPAAPGNLPTITVDLAAVAVPKKPS